MNRKVLSIFGVVLLVLAINSCSSNPEKGLLDRYFNSLAMNDTTTLSTMAISPAQFDFQSYEIVTVSEEVVEPFALTELAAKEDELKKQQEESVGVTLETRDELDVAIFERNNARSRTARAAAQRTVDEMQEAYDKQRDAHDQLTKDYNLAKEAASKEEEIANFSLGADYPNIRDFTGEVAVKDVEVRITMKDGQSNNYKIYLRRYVLEDESMNMTHRGRWIIVRFEKLS
jgi:hypothetical protein